MQVQYTCQHCGTVYLKAHNRAGKGRFCSPDCWYKASTRPLEVRFWERVQRSDSPDGCWLWLGKKTKRGYGGILGDASHDHRFLMAHRVSYELAHGAVPDELDVLHNCPNGDNPSCVRPGHLFLGTPADNMKDMIAKGRGTRGRAWNAKLTAEDVREIRRTLSEGTLSHSGIANRFGVSPSLITRINTGRAWAHVIT